MFSGLAKGETDSMGMRDQESLQRTDGALALAGRATVAEDNVVSLARLVFNLTEVERHVLARVAIHTLSWQSHIPYIAPTAHQRKAAEALASPEVKVLEAIVTVDCRQGYRLSRRGHVVVRRIFRIVPLPQMAAREREFTRMVKLMRNDWEVYD
jgi:hypothetical protein